MEILPSEFYPISGDWGKLGILHLARISLIKYYWMLQNGRVTPFTVSNQIAINNQSYTLYMNQNLKTCKECFNTIKLFKWIITIKANGLKVSAITRLFYRIEHHLHKGNPLIKKVLQNRGRERSNSLWLENFIQFSFVWRVAGWFKLLY